MLRLLAVTQRQVHGIGPQFAHDLRDDIPERNELLGKIFELRACLTKRGLGHHGAAFSSGSLLSPLLCWKRAQCEPCAEVQGKTILDTVAGLHRLISEIIDLIECGAEPGSPSLEEGNLLLERVALTLGSHAEQVEFIATGSQLGLQFATFAIKGRAKPR